MLVLTRKLDESLRIGGDIKITVLRVKGNTVRIGIEAPRDVRVVRSELKTIEASPLEDDHSSSTVAAIVDSPTIASPRLFVGKLAKGSSEVDLREQAPLRDFLRSNRSLTAVS